MSYRIKEESMSQNIYIYKNYCFFIAVTNSLEICHFYDSDSFYIDKISFHILKLTLYLSESFDYFMEFIPNYSLYLICC